MPDNNGENPKAQTVVFELLKEQKKIIRLI
jgi:hypothetical protein